MGGVASVPSAVGRASHPCKRVIRGGAGDTSTSSPVDVDEEFKEVMDKTMPVHGLNTVYHLFHPESGKVVQLLSENHDVQHVGTTDTSLFEYILKLNDLEGSNLVVLYEQATFGLDEDELLEREVGYNRMVITEGPKKEVLQGGRPGVDDSDEETGHNGKNEDMHQKEIQGEGEDMGGHSIPFWRLPPINQMKELNEMLRTYDPESVQVLPIDNRIQLQLAPRKVLLELESMNEKEQLREVKAQIQLQTQVLTTLAGFENADEQIVGLVPYMATFMDLTMLLHILKKPATRFVTVTGTAHAMQLASLLQTHGFQLLAHERNKDPNHDVMYLPMRADDVLLPSQSQGVLPRKQRLSEVQAFKDPLWLYRPTPGVPEPVLRYLGEGWYVPDLSLLLLSYGGSVTKDEMPFSPDTLQAGLPDLVTGCPLQWMKEAGKGVLVVNDRGVLDRLISIYPDGAPFVCTSNMMFRSQPYVNKHLHQWLKPHEVDMMFPYLSTADLNSFVRKLRNLYRIEESTGEFIEYYAQVMLHTILSAARGVSSPSEGKLPHSVTVCAFQDITMLHTIVQEVHDLLEKCVQRRPSPDGRRAVHIVPLTSGKVWPNLSLPDKATPMHECHIPYRLLHLAQ